MVSGRSTFYNICHRFVFTHFLGDAAGLVAASPRKPSRERGGRQVKKWYNTIKIASRIVR
jgi:hypothetical protein